MIPGGGPAGGARPRRGAALRDLGVIAHGDVLVDAGKISAVGPALQAPADAEVLEANGRVLMPGFVDCHTQACWAGDRLNEWEAELEGGPGRAQPQTDAGLPIIMGAVRAATRKQLAAYLRERLETMLRGGTTTIEVKSGFGLTTEAELKMLRAIQRTAHEWPGTVVPTALLGQGVEGADEDHVKMVLKEMLPAVSQEFPGITVDACCDEGAWPVEPCGRLLERARKRSHPIRVQADRFRSLGMVPEALRLGVTSISHLEASTKADLTLLAQSHAMGVILPGTGFHAGRRQARAGFFVDTGGALALATGCNPISAPLQSMPFALALAVRSCGLTPAEAIVAGTVNAAAALGFTDRGTIEPGQRADLILLHHRDERMLAYEVGGNPVDLVICGGVPIPPRPAVPSRPAAEVQSPVGA
ncbi:MAG: imidazolonepropionase [Verrucomicrobia bacterium RIFCSPLOWO2_12_FULL_64_8]|nr:MAG: imidazolonepropionase [Verrucomicrobia bacterium RIFCSPLOWO2_12_FULL_64_8]